MTLTHLASNQTVKNPVFWVVLISLVNIVSKSLFLNYPDIGLDEPFTLFRAQKSYPELIADLARNNHPPLFESIIWVWIRIVGFNAAWLRVIPMLFSTLAALAIFRLGKKHFSLFVGVLAALLFSFSDYQFYLSHELRSYPLFALFTTLSLHQYLDFIDNKGHNKYWIGLGVLNALLLYTHYFGAFAILTQVIHCFLVLRKRQKSLDFIKAGLLASAIYSIQAIMVFGRWAEKVEVGHWLSHPSIDEIFNVLGKYLNLPLIAFLSICFIVFGMFRLYGKGQLNKSMVLLGLFPGAYLLMWIVAQGLPVFQDRYASFTIVGLVLLMAVSINQLPRLPKLIVAGIFILGMVASVNYKPKNGQWTAEMSEIIKSKKDSNTVVMVYPKWSYHSFSYHYNLDYFRNYTNTTKLLRQDNIHFSSEPKFDWAIKQLKRGNRVIFVNFEGSIAEIGKDYGGFYDIEIIDKERQGLLIISPKKRD